MNRARLKLSQVKLDQDQEAAERRKVIPLRVHALWQDARARAHRLLVADRALEPAALALDEQGLILDCSPFTEHLFGYGRHDLLGRHVSTLLPELAGRPLVQGEYVEPQLAYLTRYRVFTGQRREGVGFACELFFNRLGNPGAAPLLLLVRSKRFEH